MISNTRSAPAMASRMALNCWDSWVIGMEKLRAYCMKATSEPTEAIRLECVSSAAPTMAMTTYWILPRLAMMGIRMLARVLAWVPASRRRSLRSSNSSCAFCSWLKTLTTRWPAIISSI